MQLYEVLLRLKEDVEGCNPLKTRTLKLPISDILKDFGVSKIEVCLSNGLLTSFKIYGNSDIMFLVDDYYRHIEFYHDFHVYITSIGRSVWDKNLLDSTLIGKVELHLSSVVKKNFSNLYPYNDDYVLEELFSYNIDMSKTLFVFKLCKLHFDSFRFICYNLDKNLGLLLNLFTPNLLTMYTYIDFIYLDLDFTRLHIDNYTLSESEKINLENYLSVFKSNFIENRFLLTVFVSSDVDLFTEKKLVKYRNHKLLKYSDSNKIEFRYNLFPLLRKNLSDVSYRETQSASHSEFVY